MDWPYYDFVPNKIDKTTNPVGGLYTEYGRERFDGKERTAAEWEEYLEANDYRGNVR
jgi:hypothetical protein